MKLSIKQLFNRDKFPIKVFVPNKEHRNVNSHGERVFIKWPFAYWVDIPKRDSKCRITYNIDPEQLTPETYEEINPNMVPVKVYAFLKNKIYRDLAKMENMKKNLVSNIDFVNGFLPFITKNVNKRRTLYVPDYDIFEFTPEDEAKEKQMEMEKYQSLNRSKQNQQNLNRLNAKNKRNNKSRKDK